MPPMQSGADRAAVAAKITHATDDFIKARLPAWLKQASPEQINALRACYATHKRSQDLLHELVAAITSPDAYAVSRLQPFLQGPLALEDDIRALYWREVRRSFRVPPGGQLPEDRIWFIHQPALQRLMQNFEPDASFYLGSGLATSDKNPDLTVQPDLTRQVDLVSTELDTISLFCREEDIGQSYQTYLDQAFTAQVTETLTQDKRSGLALAAEVAAMKGEILPAELDMLRRLVADTPTLHPLGSDWRVLQFSLLDCAVDGALAVEQHDASGQVLGVVLYLPGAPDRELYRFESWQVLNNTLATMLRAKPNDQYLRRTVNLGQLPGLLSTLGKRLADPAPDLQVTGVAAAGDIFENLAAQQVQRIKNDARLLLVPTEEADHAASAKRLEAMSNVGLAVLNVAGFFIPVVGALLLAQTVVHLTSETFEGVRDWSRGRQHEALEHLLGVAETLAVGVAVAGGAQVIAKGFARSTFVEGLVPVNIAADTPRLWSEDLQPYLAKNVPEQTQVLDNGLHSDGQRYWWRHDNNYYQVRQHQGRWQLQHPHRDDAYAPSLQFNGERSWRLGFERPLEWQGSAQLLRRLWPEAANLDAQRIEQILQVTGVDEEELRGLLVENRALPVSLRDTVERFDVDARVDAFFTHLEQNPTGQTEQAYYTWCLAQIETAGLSEAEQRAEVVAQAGQLRAPLFEHFARQYVPANDGLAVIQRDFPGLPDAYASYLLKQAGDAQRLRVTEQRQIPLALAEQARSLLRHARLTRMREGLFLRHSYQPDTVDLAFNLLRKNANWPSSVNLELREGSEYGRRFAVLDPQNRDAQVMVWRGGRFELSDVQGQALDIDIDEPAGLPEVLLAVLPHSHRTRLGWDASDAAGQVRRDLQRWMPAQRQTLERLLGWPQIKPWFNPGQRLADGRVGYLLSGRGEGTSQAEATLRARIRALYVGFSDQQVEDFLNLLLQAPGSAFDNLLSQEQEFEQLEATLTAWEADDAQPSAFAARRTVADEMRRCWRLQGDRSIDQQGRARGMRLNVTGVAVQTLPELPAQINFGHVSELTLINLQLRQLPANFLYNFRSLRRLNLSGNQLTALPANLSLLTELRALQLSNNMIPMTQASASIVGNLRQLQELMLSHNPLGAISLDLSNLSHLSELYLRNCALPTMPSGLIRCTLLDYADLRNNGINSIPEAILQAPRAFRRTLSMQGNALSAGVQQRLAAPDPAPVQGAVADGRRSRELWTQNTDAQLQQQRATIWDNLRTEPGSNDFFQLISELSGTGDFRRAREDLQRRVWEMFEAAQQNTELRQELFNLASNPRTCVDSVASCFSTLEVRVFAARTLQNSAPGRARAVRLDLARRLFRLDQVERIARADIDARRAAGRGVDEIEVSLAYRSGLARELVLPGQPNTMQFREVARVSDKQLANAAEAVREAEASTALAHYISERDFWLEYLRTEYAERFSTVEQPFWTRLDALGDQEDISEGEYLQQANQLASEREQALKALALNLTQEALAADLAGEGDR
ncbi:MAG: NEL-type E3 ubiquitin ligase domain-containing protein [Pseudomonas sp.]